MSVQKIAQTAALEGLEDWGRVGKPLSEPACRLRGWRQDIPGTAADIAGVWECSPGSFRRDVAQGEVMHILAGAGTFTPDGGLALAFAAGDSLFFPPLTTGTWEIRETVRKLYVLVPPQQEAGA